MDLKKRFALHQGLAGTGWILSHLSDGKIRGITAVDDQRVGLDAPVRRAAARAAAADELRRRDAGGELVPSLAGFAWSVLHAHVNRLAHTAQRTQELVLLDFLCRLSGGDS